MTAAERAARLRGWAADVRRVPATGANVHDLAAVRGLADTAADIAEAIAAGGVAADDWRHAWLDRAEAELAHYREAGLAGWRRVYRGR